MEDIENNFLNYKLASELKKLGFNEKCFGFHLPIDHDDYKKGDIIYHQDKYEKDIPSILWQQAFKFFRDVYGLYVHSVPEFYYTGINFNWQIFWYLPKEKWTKYSCNGGTFLYGDNGEYPTQEAADIAMIEKMIDIVKNKILK